MREKNGFFHSFSTSVWRSGRNGRFTWAGVLWPERYRSSRHPRGAAILCPVVCVIGCQITRKRIRTLPKRLASARHNRVKTVLLPDSCTSNKTFSEDEEEDDVFSRRSLYYGRSVSDVMGCRRPTNGVLHMYLQTRVTLRPLGDAVRSSHEGEQWFTWIVLCVSQIFQ